MSEKRYTVELSAEELARMVDAKGVARPELIGAHAYNAVCRVIAQAQADREADELRLPWRAKNPPGGSWYLVCRGRHEASVDFGRDALACKLASAAPELLDAVMFAKAAIRAAANGETPAARVDVLMRMDERIERALRKAETGVPEEP